MKRIYIVILAILLVFELSGCAVLKKKFTRKKKPLEVETVYYELEEYSREPNGVLYKRYYTFWRTWQAELINKMGENPKKDMRCAGEIINSLQSMQRFLLREKADELAPYIDEMEGVRQQLSDRNIATTSRKRLKRILEIRYRQMGNVFSYRKVKDFILPDQTGPPEPEQGLEERAR